MCGKTYYTLCFAVLSLIVLVGNGEMSCAPAPYMDFTGLYSDYAQNGDFGEMEASETFSIEIQGNANALTAIVYGIGLPILEDGALTGIANGTLIDLIGNAQDPNDPNVAYRTDLNGTGVDENNDGAADMIDFQGKVTVYNNNAPVEEQTFKFKAYRN